MEQKKNTFRLYPRSDLPPPNKTGNAFGINTILCWHMVTVNMIKLLFIITNEI